MRENSKNYVPQKFLCIQIIPLTRLSKFLALQFCATKLHKPKNWLCNACLVKPSLAQETLVL